ncbi:hypothetical protein EVAR_40270_1 [Eumeta japonica]|uniref:Uncharacterized protein n=1 Tax=Eumeta variegata TaxID=151549 RepID=A0A4C1WZE6_EUMVA|nr:hypothetical protein EVAR_40270_1 [Eumeta japonica]
MSPEKKKPEPDLTAFKTSFSCTPDYGAYLLPAALQVNGFRCAVLKCARDFKFIKLTAARPEILMLRGDAPSRIPDGSPEAFRTRGGTEPLAFESVSHSFDSHVVFATNLNSEGRVQELGISDSTRKTFGEARES